MAEGLYKALGELNRKMKGFALDDNRLKNLGGGNYFDELLARIRDIRSSEKVFWRKVLEIYATSIDYDPNAESSILFFKQVQNKMHWAAHKHTAAEVIYQRADAQKENMGLTSWSNSTICRSDVEVAKNYLTNQELDALNKIVAAPLDIAEVHDCFSINGLLAIEDLGFFKKGEGGKAIEDGLIERDGQVAVNTSGGLKARGHPLGATGIAQAAEVTWQLRGEADKRQVDGAEIGLTQNIGGTGGTVAVHILSRNK